mgnify:CR=1 FL=1
MEIKTVGVIGAGQMGNGIAHVMALAGYDVTLNDLNEEALNAARQIGDDTADQGDPKQHRQALVVLNDATELPGPHHVENDMENAEVQEYRRQQSPDLAARYLG